VALVAAVLMNQMSGHKPLRAALAHDGRYRLGHIVADETGVGLLHERRDEARAIGRRRDRWHGLLGRAGAWVLTAPLAVTRYEVRGADRVIAAVRRGHGPRWLIDTVRAVVALVGQRHQKRARLVEHEPLYPTGNTPLRRLR